MSALNPVSSYLAILFILGVSVIREGIEDYERYKSDKVTNRQLVRILRNGKIIEGESKNVTVGDIILIEEDEFFPADLVMLASSNENASCLIKTSSLDGESAPKVKKVPKGLDWVIPSGSAKFRPDELISTFKATIEAPSSNLYSFEGKLILAKKNYRLTHE